MQLRRRVRRKPASAAGRRSAFLLLIAVLAFIVCSSVYFRTISTQIAVSDASDLVTIRINSAISEALRDGAYNADSFVSFEKNAGGEVSAISCNMSEINALSAEILEKVVGTTDNYTATVEIPLGNLTGLSLLMGRGPKVPVEIVTLTSSRVEFTNNIVTAGINQTKHQITLLIRVDIDILIPWGSVGTQVVSEVLIADTVVVGQVPGTYLDIKGSSP
ncbi:MAG: sporulation protein YunB [Oscillospiraceae bacterium]|nr:sporulation protein YunB [Oscillospiraceae bacterium]